MCIRDRVKAISTAASVTIPAGETTWGAVFIANGLQLILAVLLIVLGLNIVVHSFKAYQKAEPVSYTHLDVYKRQVLESPMNSVSLW